MKRSKKIILLVKLKRMMVFSLLLIAKLKASNLFSAFNVGYWFGAQHEEHKVATCDSKVAGFTPLEMIEAGNISRLAYVRDIEQISELNDDHYNILEIKESLRASGYKIIKFGTTSENSGVVAICPDSGRIFIGYHGVDNHYNLLTTAWFNWAASYEMKGRFHNGFLHTFEQTKVKLMSILKEIAFKQGKTIDKLEICLVGHSMGGALAHIAAKYLKEVKKVEKLKVVAFAAPRSMDVVAAKHYDEMLSNRSLNIFQDWDLVSFVPPNFLWGALHVGTKMRIPSLNGMHKLTNYLETIEMMRRQYQQNQEGLKSNVFNIFGYKFWEVDYKFEGTPSGGVFSYPFIRNSYMPNPLYALYCLDIVVQKFVLYPSHWGFKITKDSVIDAGKSVMSSVYNYSSRLASSIFGVNNNQRAIRAKANAS